MDLPLGLILKGFDAFILVFVRMTGLFVIAPIFGRRNLPAYFKIGFSLLLALIVINTIKIPDLENYISIYQFALVVIKEFVVGITLGYVSYIVFSGIYMAGQLIDMQIGFGVVNVFDPISNIQVPITANFYYIITMLLFLTVNGHHYLILALYDSYKYIPLGSAVFSTSLMDDIIRNFTNMFILGFRIGAPIIAAILITDVVLGVISRTIPQINIFVVGMPLKILVGILVIILTIPMFIGFVDYMINGMNSEMLQFMKDMGKK